MRRGVEEERGGGGVGGGGSALYHCLLSFFHPQYRHNQHITHSISLLHTLTLPIIVLFPFHFPFNSSSSSPSPPLYPPPYKSPSSASQRIPFSFLSQPRGKCKHLRQTEVRGRGERQSSLINWRPHEEVTAAVQVQGSWPQPDRGESQRSYNNTSENILLIMSHRSRLVCF